MKRINYIDTVKGLAIIMITLGHITELSNPLDSWMSLSKICAFYIISGYLYAYNNTLNEISLRGYFFKLIKRLMIPYFWFNVIAMILRSYRAFMRHKSIILLLKSDLINFLTLKGFSATWFLPTLLISSMIFLFVYQGKEIKGFIIKSITFTIIMILIVKMYGYLPEMNVVFSNVILVLSKSVIAVWFIAIGYAYQRWIEHRIPQNSSLLIGILLIAITIGLTKFSRHIDFNLMEFGDYPIVFFMGGVIATIGFLLLFKSLETKGYIPKVLNYFGKTSIMLLGVQRCLMFINIIRSGWDSYIGAQETTNLLFYIESFAILALVLLMTYGFTMFFYKVAALYKKQNTIKNA